VPSPTTTIIQAAIEETKAGGNLTKAQALATIAVASAILETKPKGTNA
jgi:hypothetical protein